MKNEILAEGFTPLIDVLVAEHGIIRAAVFGKVWRYTQMSRGMCDASTETMATELGCGRQTIMRHLQALCDDGYLIDETPNLRNRPHTYKTTEKVNIEVKISAVPQSDSAVPESNSAVPQRDTTVPKSNMKILREKEDTTLAEKPTRPRDELFDAIAFVCKVDPLTAGSTIAKVKVILAKAGYTPADVLEYGRRWSSNSFHTEPPSVWNLKEKIGTVKTKPIVSQVKDPNFRSRPKAQILK